MKELCDKKFVRSLIEGNEEIVMKALFSIDRIFEILCLKETEVYIDCVESERIIDLRQRKENATGPEIFLERLLVQCIQFWEVGLIENKNDLHAIIQILLPVELGERYGKEVDEYEN